MTPPLFLCRYTSLVQIDYSYHYGDNFMVVFLNGGELVILCLLASNFLTWLFRARDESGSADLR